MTTLTYANGCVATALAFKTNAPLINEQVSLDQIGAPTENRTTVINEVTVKPFAACDREKSILFSSHITSAEGPINSLKKTLLALKTAESEFGFSRVSFWRFRKRHRIYTLPGRRISMEDILEAFAAERAGRRRIAIQPGVRQ